eukprot:15448850-Alexandrium_andersonii.AAC.1
MAAGLQRASSRPNGLFAKAKRVLHNRPSKAESTGSAARSSGSTAPTAPCTPSPTPAEAGAATGQLLLAPLSQG